MTDLLKETLTSRATETEPPPLDLDTIMATGTRRLRRRRAGSILGTALAVVGVVATGLTVVRTNSPAPADSPAYFSERQATYAVGGTIHSGDATIDTGAQKISRLVLSDAGILFTAVGSQTLRVTDGKKVRELAELAPESRLVASGELAGWEQRTPDGYRTVVKNLQTGATIFELDHVGTLSAPTADRPALGHLVAVDGDYVYLEYQQDMYEVDLRTGNGRVMSTPSDQQSIVTFGSGHLVFVAAGLGHESAYIGFSDRTGTGGSVQNFSGAVEEIVAAVSPKGHYVALKAGATPLRIYNSNGGRRNLAGTPPQRFGHWLSADTFLAATAGPPADLVTCTVQTAEDVTCRISRRSATPDASELVFPSN
ncbi:hypothetical protein GCM10009745_77740 [Kribbella yunnanensis]|uniref:WD40 repeat domain-containing protein n=1 Tax=Kribbella yunnanensis TaxID=190194 RepID=A0ABP4V6C3_9ACTN